MKTSLRELARGCHRGAIVASAALGVAASGVALAVPWVIGDGVTRLVGGDSSLHWTLAAIVVLLVLRLTLDVASALVAGREKYGFVARLRAIWHGHVLALPPGTAADERRQEWVSILSYDIPRVAELIVEMPVALTRGVVTLLGVLALMVTIHPLLTAVVFVTAPLAYLLARVAVRALRARASKFWDLEVEVMSRAEEAFRASWAIKAFGQEARFAGEFDGLADHARDAGVAHLKLLALIGPAIQFVTFCGMVLVVLVASTGVGKELSPGELLSFVLYGLLLSAPLRAFADSWSAWQEASATLGRFDALAALVPEPSTGTRILAEVEGALDLDALVFSWRDDALLDEASLEVQAGEHIALIGPNGAGKTTLIALLLGFARPTRGQIRVDGVPLDELSDSGRRGLFAVVPQHAALFGGTIGENVAFARPEASVAQIREALRLACGLDFVDALPDGLATRIGEGGLQLSGGQRQRIAIARALLTEAPFLVLDEATSGFDAESSSTFSQNLAELPHRTVIWITHEELPQQSVDRVVRLRAGRFEVLPSSDATPTARAAFGG